MKPMRFLLSTTLLLFLSFPSLVLSESLWDETVESILSLPSSLWGETVDWDDLVEREGLYYKKFTSDVPFTGGVEGQEQGKMKNGKKDGEWVEWADGKVWCWKGTYKNGKREGEWVSYHYNGQLSWKGTFRDGKKDGEWVFYNRDGTEDLTGESTYGLGQGSGIYKNDYLVE